MSRWNLFGGGSTDELPDTIQNKRGTTGDSAFEVFIEGALTTIYNSANGRSQDQKRIRESCKKIIGASLQSPMSTGDAGVGKADLLAFFNADNLNDEQADVAQKISAPLSKEAAEEVSDLRYRSVKHAAPHSFVVCAASGASETGMWTDPTSSGGACSCMLAQTGKSGITIWKSKTVSVYRHFNACRLLMHTCKLKAPLVEERATTPLLLR